MPAHKAVASIADEEAERVPVAAILMFVVALFLAAANGAIMKQLTDTLATATIIWGRYSVYLLIMLPFALPFHGLSVLRPPDLSLQLIRVALMLLGTWCFVTGVADLAYADAIAILYVYPFVIIALSPFFLAERVSPAAWMCVAAGFAGVLIVMRPSFDVTGIPALFILIAGVILGAHLVLTRRLVRAKSPLITSTFTALVISAVT
ncbi:MAG: DMT family transporter, partial [Aestuariivirgaceae bacterium]